MSYLSRSYQFLCLVFLFLNFQANISSSSSSTSSITKLCSDDEASALIQFKSTFSTSETYPSFKRCSDAGIKAYAKTDSWNEGTNCCDWDGVTCDDIKGQVVGLDLSCSLLYGSIPSNSSLFLLPHLQKLNLAFNHFNHSKMPSKFGRFASLESLNLSGTHFAKEVPSQVSHLSKLVSLDLSGSYYKTLDKHTLKGLVHNLTEVRQLFLDGIDMSSVNPNVLMNLSLSLTTLSLESCNLQGKFPENIFHLPNLKLLNLRKNEGLILNLPELNRSSHLKLLDLSAISFSRESIDSIGNLLSLKSLSLQGSNLSGSIPKSLGNLSQLSYIDLSYNSFSGHIPSWLHSLSSLEYIGLSHNQFNGYLQEFQCSLRVIDLSFNKLQGPIPSSISQLLNLTSLYLSSNNLSGIVEFGMFSKLENLQELDLSSNSLSLNSNGIGADYTLPNIRSLSLSFFNFTEFPKFLLLTKSLQRLDLSNNRIFGSIPEWMWEVGKDSLSYLNLSHNSLTEVKQLPWKKIEFLDLSSNLITGDLPIPPLTTYVYSISNNSLSGEIPSGICNLDSLGLLDLSHNNLSGVIPTCFGNLSKSVWMLSLQMNKFRGFIPQTFVKDCQLKNLNLNGNQLEGPLTRSIINCRGLEVLDLGNNKIDDTFPHWLASLPQLQVLVLRSNRLRGSIQDSESNFSFSKIQIFDLSSNHFSGTLPVRYIQNFQGMINLTNKESATLYMGVSDRHSGSFYSYSVGIAMKGLEMKVEKIFTLLSSIDLSNNRFQGEIPEVIGKLNSLIGLNLSRNNLSGRIPTSIGNLRSLEWLDLSSNNLIGKIPEQLLDVTSLSCLNLSENELVGCIPRGKQFNTFENNSYEGNKGLRGFPLSRDCNQNEPPQSPQSNLVEEDGSKSSIAFGWKVVLIGYVCGVIFGLVIGYVVFQTGKPKWLVTLFEDRRHKRRKSSRISNRRGGGRRT